MLERSKPSDIVLTAPPLCDTFGHAEAEHAAALLVRCCQVLGDRWQPISSEQLGQVLNAEVAAKTLIGKLAFNPFFNPAPHELIEHEWARRLDAHTVELTEAGLDRIEKWSRRHA